MRTRGWVVLWAVVVVALVVVELAQVSGVLRPADIVTNFFLLLIVLVVIAVLAAIGAGFLGVFITHRIFSTQEFTPFEEEMLKMREEVKRMADRLEAVADKVGMNDSGGDDDQRP